MYSRFAGPLGRVLPWWALIRHRLPGQLFRPVTHDSGGGKNPLARWIFNISLVYPPFFSINSTVALICTEYRRSSGLIFYQTSQSKLTPTVQDPFEFSPFNCGFLVENIIEEAVKQNRDSTYRLLKSRRPVMKRKRKTSITRTRVCEDNTTFQKF